MRKDVPMMLFTRLRRWLSRTPPAVPPASSFPNLDDLPAHAELPQWVGAATVIHRGRAHAAPREVATPVGVAAARHAELLGRAGRAGRADGLHLDYGVDGEPFDAGGSGRRDVATITGFPAWRLAHVDDLYTARLGGVAVDTATLACAPLCGPRRPANTWRGADPWRATVDTFTLRWRPSSRLCTLVQD